MDVAVGSGIALAIGEAACDKLLRSFVVEVAVLVSLLNWADRVL